jgi:hypothetical protein
LHQRKQSEWAREPPENGITQSPTHAGAVAPNIALEEQAKGRTDDESNTELQQHLQGLRMDIVQTGDQWEESAFEHPTPKNQPTDHAGDTAGNDRSAQTKRWTGIISAQPSANAKSKPDGRSQTHQIRRQLGEEIARVLKRA